MNQALRASNRVFLFLQGPHGPFFRELSEVLSQSGAICWRVGFNAGDSVFWRDRDRYIAFRDAPTDWPDTFREILRTRRITDLVLYGDVRPIHAQAIDIARQADLTIHVFEEGYLRPFWVTYEHGGSNGRSRLIGLDIDDMDKMLETQRVEPPVPPCHWGDMRQHVFFGALYHWFVLFWNRRYPCFTPHRALNVSAEFRLYLKRLLLMPFQALDRMIATSRIRRRGFPYHLALLQLEHDSSFQAHSPFDTQLEFLMQVIEGFAQGAPGHHHLIFKAHPLEDGRAPLRRDIRRLAKAQGIADRVHYLPGGKLAGLLNEAKSAVTVNSTAGQQVLWRGIPLRIFGTAVYGKPQLVSGQPLPEFFAAPERPDIGAYRKFRDFLLATSQLPGSFYAVKGRHQLVRGVADMMLSGADPYTLSTSENAAVRQQLRVVT